ncbi:MAG: hypothetical protein QM755_09275 [Luteolibacter sp.]
MKRPISMILAAAALCGLAQAEELLKLPELKTKTGKVYQNVVVTKKTGADVSIQHGDGGLAHIQWDDLPDDVAKQLGGFDPAKVAEAKKAEHQAQAAFNAEMDAGANTGKPRSENQAARDSSGKMRLAVIRVIATKEGGALCRVSWMEKPAVMASKKGALDSDYKLGKTKDVGEDEVSSPPVMSGYAREPIFIKGLPDVTEGKTLGIAVIGKDGAWESVGKPVEVKENAGAPPNAYGAGAKPDNFPTNFPKPWWYYTGPAGYLHH